MDKIIERIAKINNIVSELSLVKIMTPIIVPRKHTGRLKKKIFFENDL